MFILCGEYIITKYNMNGKKNALKVAVVTAMFLIETDKMDECGGVPDKNPEWDYILFTNNKTKLENVDGWDIREIDCSAYTHGVYASKRIKWFTHEFLPDYDIIIWVDSFITPNLKMLGEIDAMINSVHLNPNMPLIMRTQKFECIKDDIDWCLVNNRITEEMASNIINHLDKSGIIKADEKTQTYWSAAIVKNNKHPVLQTMVNELFELVTTIGYRDQHWIPYLFRKYSLHCGINRTKDVFIITGKQIKTNHHYTTFF
jgi:hypothetical protein